MSEGEGSDRQESAGPDGLFGRTFAALQFRDFRLVWLGAFTSTIGTWTQQVAQAWLVYQISDSAFLLGLTAFLGEVPFILFTLIGGAVADRIDRRRVLLLSQYLQMASALILALLIGLDAIRIWHFLVLVFVVGTAQAFGGPSYQALLPGLVPRRYIANAIALNSIQFNLSKVIGPVLAGVLMSRFDPVFCFAINGLSFLAVVVSLKLIKPTFLPRKSGRSVMGDIASGFSFLLEQGALWQLTVLGFIGSFCAFPLLTMLPVFARDVFQLDSGGFSTMMAAQGAGAVAGALLYANLAQIGKKGKLTLWVMVGFSAFLGAFSLSNSLPLSLILLFFSGVGLLIFIASINSLVQLATSEEMRGRVTSFFMLSFRGGMPLGNLFTGSMAVHLSPPDALAINALILAITGIVTLVLGRGVKRL